MIPDLTAIEARLKAATPGPWFTNGRHISSPNRGKKNLQIGEVGYPGCVVSKIDKRNAAFIAHAPTDLIALLAYCRKLERIKVCAMQVIPDDVHSCAPEEEEHDTTCGPCQFQQALAALEALGLGGS